MHRGEPVFVDGTGRRREILRAAGAALGVVLVGYVVVLGVGLGLNANVPVTAWVMPEKAKQTAPVHTQTGRPRTPSAR
jgi:hypothetical protein